MLRQLSVFTIFFSLLLNGVKARVEASRYDSFWIWSGVITQPVLNSAKTLYLLQGQISESRQSTGNTNEIISQRMATPFLPRQNVWIVYRTDTLRWSDSVYIKIFAELQRWERAGNNVIGIQIDFDARTRFLGEYKDFLKDFRKRLPKNYQLSITGLMDWGNNADRRVLTELNGIVDEIVIQTYQGRKTIPNYGSYVPRLNRMGLPFKIGIVQGGEWEDSWSMENNSWFRGYVVFLLNSK